MHGTDTFTKNLFTRRKLEDFAPTGRPSRANRQPAYVQLMRTRPLLTGMFEEKVKSGQPNIASERSSRAMLLQPMYLAWPERHLTRPMLYNLPIHWFIGLSTEDVARVLNVSTNYCEGPFEQAPEIECFYKLKAIAQQQWPRLHAASPSHQMISASCG